MAQDEQLPDEFKCAEHQVSFDNRSDYLSHRASAHADGLSDADADTQELETPDARGSGDEPLAGFESSKSQQPEDPGDRVVAYGQNEDHQAEMEDVDPSDREVHRPPVPGTSGRTNRRE